MAALSNSIGSKPPFYHKKRGENMKKAYRLTIKGFALIQAIESGLIQLDSAGNVPKDEYARFNKFWKAMSAKYALNKLDDRPEMFNENAYNKNQKLKKYLANGAKAAGFFLLGCLVEHFLAG